MTRRFLALLLGGAMYCLALGCSDSSTANMPKVKDNKPADPRLKPMEVAPQGAPGQKQKQPGMGSKAV